MMGRIVVAVAMAFCISGSCFSQAKELVDPGNIAQQRQLLNQERDDAMRLFDEQVAHCKSQFAVSGCLKDANQTRLTRLSEIRKALTKLDDQERLARGKEQRAQLDAKAAERLQQIENDVAPKSKLNRETATQEKTPRIILPSKDGNKSKAREPALTAEQQSENRQAYAAKQAQAEEKRLEREKRLREKDPAVKGLPQ